MSNRDKILATNLPSKTPSSNLEFKYLLEGYKHRHTFTIQFRCDNITKIHHKVPFPGKEGCVAGDIFNTCKVCQQAIAKVERAKTHVFQIVPVLVGSALELRQTVPHELGRWKVTDLGILLSVCSR